MYEGERASTDACNELGKFTINGIERAKRGEPQVNVTFDIDGTWHALLTILPLVARRMPSSPHLP